MAIALADKGLVTVFGGSGFLGRHVVRALLKRGWRVRAAVRRPDLAGFLQPLGMVGWVQPIQANLRYRWSVDRAVEGADAVVNLVAILTPSGRQSFEAVNVFGARAVAEAARAQGLDRDRPRLGDRREPGLALRLWPEQGRGRSGGVRDAAEIGGDAALDHVRAGGSFLQPLRRHGADVAGPAADRRRQDEVPAGLRRRRGARHRRCGRGQGEGRARSTNSAARRSDSFRECMELMLQVIGRKRLLVPLPWGVASLLGSIFQYLPGKVLTPDQVRELRVDNIVSEAAIAERRTIEAFGIEPTTLGSVLPTYLSQYRVRGEYEKQAV